MVSWILWNLYGRASRQVHRGSSPPPGGRFEWDGEACHTSVRRGRGALFSAAEKGRGRGALFSAAEKGRHNMVAILLKLGKDPNRADSYGITPLQIAVWNNHCKTVECLVGHCADVNLADRTGHSPLYKAVFRGCERCVCSLLQAGADVNQQDSSGKTALMASVELGHMSLTQLLLGSGADVDKPNGRGETALHVAATGGKVDAVRLLLRHGSNPNATAAGGRTPLSSTVNRRSSPAALEILALLIRANANVELKGRHIYVGDGRALTPFEVAVRGGNLDAARLLAMAGCNIKAARAWLVGINTPRALLQDADMVELLRMLTTTPLPLMVQCRQVVRKSVHNIYDLSKLRLPVPMLHYLEIPELDTVLEKTRVINSHDSGSAEHENAQ